MVGFLRARAAARGRRSRASRRSATSATARCASTRGSSTRSTIAGSTGSWREITRRLGFALEPARPFEFTTNGDRFGWIEGHRRPLAPDAAHRVRPRRATRERARHAHRPARDRAGPSRRLPADAEPEPDRRGRRARRHARSSMRWSCATASTRIVRATPLCARCARLRGAADLPARDGRGGALPAARSSRLGRRAARGARARAASRCCCASRGCPNGCARPYLAEIALIGKAPGRYNLYLGGDGRGQRLNVLLPRERRRADHPRGARRGLCAVTRPSAQPGERFGDFAWRAGLVGARMAPEGGAVMRALAWNPEHALHEPAVLDEIELRARRACTRRSACVGACSTCPGEHALSSSFGAQAAVSLHMVTRAAAVDPGRPGRYRATCSRRPIASSTSSSSGSAQPEGLPAADVAGLARSAPRPALGAGCRRHRALQRAAQDRADAARARRARHADAGSPACAATSRESRKPASGRSSGATAAGRCTRSSTGPIATCSSTCAGTTCRITRSGTKATSRSATGTRRARSPRPGRRRGDAVLRPEARVRPARARRLSRIARAISVRYFPLFADLQGPPRAGRRRR